jgi:beta-barrel assembly-enhancing protease
MSATFQGGVFSKELTHGRAGARVQVQADAVLAITDAGSTFEVDARECQLQLGGASGKMWFCHNADRSLTIYSEAESFGQALHAAPRLRAQVERLVESARRGKRRERAWLSLGLLALGLVVLGGYFGIRAAGALALHALPVSADVRIGDLALASIDKGGAPVVDPTLQQALDRMVGRLAEHSGKKGFVFRVHVIESSTVNAFALPGGNLVVYTGLLRAADAPDQVAGVLGHEMAHVTQRHGMQRIAHALGLAAAVNVLLGDVSGLAALGAEMLKAGTLTSYGRDQERDADLEGVRLLHRAGIDPLGLSQFFATLEKEQPAGQLKAAVSWLSSHPELSERREAVRARVKALGPLKPRPLELDWEEIRRRAGHRASDRPNDEEQAHGK